MHKEYSQCETETNILCMRISVNKFLVFRTFLSKNCYT